MRRKGSPDFGFLNGPEIEDPAEMQFDVSKPEKTNNVGIMEKKMKTTFIGLYRVEGLGIMEQKMETTRIRLCRV